MRPLNARIGWLCCVSVLSLVGCAPLPVQKYACANGADFTLRQSAVGTEIEVAGMRFGLQAENPDGSGERLTCSMLTVWRDGGTARVEMEGRPYLDNCRLAE
jgi:membrane-bound inhibitor of C-type lysozyme